MNLAGHRGRGRPNWAAVVGGGVGGPAAGLDRTRRLCAISELAKLFRIGGATLVNDSDGQTDILSVYLLPAVRYHDQKERVLFETKTGFG